MTRTRVQNSPSRSLCHRQARKIIAGNTAYLFLKIDKTAILNIMRNTMENPSSPAPDPVRARLQDLGARIRARRKALGVNATAAAESAGMSRVTLHRIEKGEPSVAMGAWAHLVAALGMDWALNDPADACPTMSPRSGWVPLNIALDQYPQLRALAWQVHGTDTLTPAEAFDIYERNARHLDLKALSPLEHDLWLALQAAFSGRGGHV